jgi:riboflavin biosynthesis pyrimidine reductase
MLRIPTTSRLLQTNQILPWLVCSQDADPARKNYFERKGVRVIIAPVQAAFGLDMRSLLPILATNGLSSLMVEGGARVISSFLNDGFVDWAVVTIVPRWIGGQPAVYGLAANSHLPVIENPLYEIHGQDMVIAGKINLEGL